MINEEKTRKKIQQLVILSRTGEKLDAAKIVLIAKGLKKRELVLYCRYLLRARNEEKVFVTTAVAVPGTFSSGLSRAFPHKDVEFYEDPRILGGMKVAFGDFVFDGTLLTFLKLFEREHENN